MLFFCFECFFVNIKMKVVIFPVMQIKVNHLKVIMAFY